MAAAGVLGGAALVGVGMTSDGGGGVLATAGIRDAEPTPSPSPTGPSPEELRKIEREKQVKKLDAALKKYATDAPEFSVAVFDTKTGEDYSFRGEERYETASVVKVQVLACLLLTAQDDDRDLTGNELSLAKRMITASDNAATTSLFGKLGRYTGISACNKRLGLKQTKVNTAWGLTRTTVDDQVKLLNELADEESPLDSDSRKVAYDLMNSVLQDQDWGVPAAAKTGEEFTVKNGWLSRSTEGGRWIINSVGRVTGPDTDVSIAVLTHGNASMTSGINVVEKVSKMTREYLEY